MLSLNEKVANNKGEMVMQLILSILCLGILVPMTQAAHQASKQIPLFRAYPALGKKIPYINLGNFPTPIYKAEAFANRLNIKNFYIKRDDLSGLQIPNNTILPGGNKVRKLEFLLADALTFGASSVLTVGDAGSNHAMTTAAYAQHLGLKSFLMLAPQPPTAYTRRNLLLDVYFGADIRYFSSSAQRDVAITKLARDLNTQKQPLPYFIPIGGSNEIGSIGFINAAFELKEQIEAGIMPTPDIIYVTCGSTGMVAGLMIGLKIANISCTVIPVRVSMTAEHKKFLLLEILNKTAAYVHSHDTTVPLLHYTQEDVLIENNFIGPDYAAITQEASQAIELLFSTEGIKLDGTYTGKTLAAVISDAQQGKLGNKTILFWNSFSAGDYKSFTNKIDYKKLPKGLHFYFETQLQKLDQGY